MVARNLLEAQAREAERLPQNLIDEHEARVKIEAELQTEVENSHTFIRRIAKLESALQAEREHYENLLEEVDAACAAITREETRADKAEQRRIEERRVALRWRRERDEWRALIAAVKEPRY